MKRRFAWAPLIGLGLVGSAGGETSRIERRDGSIVMRRGRGLRGRPLSGRVARLRRVTIDQAEIRSLQPGGTAGGGPGGYGGCRA